MSDFIQYQYYGRKKMRSLRSSQKDALLPEKTRNILMLDDFKESPYKHIFDNNKPLTLEIGFGMGEHILHHAKSDPSYNYIGLEPFINGYAKVIKSIHEDDISNLKVSREDARHVLQILPNNCISRIFILFPDPWPKKRHFKRRLIQKDFLIQLHRVLNPIDGKLIIATDHASYQKWITEMMAESDFKQELMNGQKTPNDQPNGWFVTKYQARAIKEGRSSLFLQYVR